MKKSILPSLILVLSCINISYSQRFVETIPGNKDGGIRIFNSFTSSEIPPNTNYVNDTIFGIKNLLQLRTAVFSYYSYRKMIASSNEAINNHQSEQTIGVRGLATNNITYPFGGGNYGIYGQAKGLGYNYGVFGTTTGEGYNNYGIYGSSHNYSSTNYSNNYGVNGYSTSYSPNGFNYGVYGSASNSADASKAFAGYFSGNVHVNGTLSKSGGSFKIDHPQDPENKYLVHSFVESPDMMNIYNGNVTTDNQGLAIVQLPTYFESLNIDFRYQLTVMGKFSQAIIKREVQNNSFIIETDKPNTKVSWQVTGVRNDAYAKKNRIVPEQEKKGNEKGKYLNPEVFDLLKEQSIHFHEAKAPKSK